MQTKIIIAVGLIAVASTTVLVQSGIFSDNQKQLSMGLKPVASNAVRQKNSEAKPSDSAENSIEETLKIPGALTKEQQSIITDLADLRQQVDADIAKALAEQEKRQKLSQQNLEQLKQQADLEIAKLEKETGIARTSVEADFAEIWYSTSEPSESIKLESDAIDEQLLEVERNLQIIAE